MGADVQMGQGEEIPRVGRMCPGRGKAPWERWVGDATALGRGYPTTHCHCVLPQHHFALRSVNKVPF